MVEGPVNIDNLYSSGLSDGGNGGERMELVAVSDEKGTVINITGPVFRHLQARWKAAHQGQDLSNQADQSTQ